MFQPRRIESHPNWLDGDGTKLYTVSATDGTVDQAVYLPRLKAVKSARTVDWASTPSFAIFHDGATARYLVLAWWGNDNELLNSVSVEVNSEWVEDPDRYSFCLWDLEIIWAERNFFVESVYCQHPDLDAYRRQRM